MLSVYPIKPSEHEICAQFADILRLHKPQLDANGVVWTKNQNEGKRGFKTQNILKTEGMTKGWPDYEIIRPFPHGYQRVMFIEFKGWQKPLYYKKDGTPGAQRRGTLTDEQKDFRDYCIKYHIPWSEQDDALEAWEWLKQYIY